MLNLFPLVRFHRSRHAFPDISLYRFHEQVWPGIDLGSFRRQDFTAEFIVHFRYGKFFGGRKTRKFTCIVFLSVEDGRMLHRAGYTGFPVLTVGSIQFLAAIGECQLQDRTEGALFPYHPLMAGRRYYLVRPPSRGNLGRKFVGSAFPFVKQSCHIVCERAFCLGIMSETRFKDLLPDQDSVDIQFIHSESRGHPLRRHNLALVPEVANKP